VSIKNQTLTFILAGGVGSRLKPLTSARSKPSVPFGGKYRIIDFTLSNCLHSGLRRVLVLTQYKSHSLNKHLRDGWSIYNPELGEYITAVPAQMNEGNHWYQGTADAIYQNLNLLERSDADYTLILSGDHIYRMDYDALLDAHKDSGAAVTIACMEVPVEEASAFGVVSVNKDLQITAFEEKPEQPTTLPDNPEKSLVSMGLYVFSSELLKDALVADQKNPDSNNDFGQDILPTLLKDHVLQAYKFGSEEGRVVPDRYWRDVGDVFGNSMLANGVVISGGEVRHSILFRDVYIDDKATVSKSLLFEGVYVGEGASLHNCIIDKNVRIPAMTQIGVDLEQDKQRFTVSDNGIVVVPEGYVF